MFLFHSSKIEGRNLGAFVIWKKRRVVLDLPKHKKVFFSRLFITGLKLFRHVIATLLWLWHNTILKDIWKFWHWRFGINTVKIYFFDTKFYFSLASFLEIIKHLWLIQVLCSFIWYQYHFATITRFSIIFFLSRGIHWCCRKKIVWILKVSILSTETIEKLFSKTFILEFLIQVHLQVF